MPTIVYGGLRYTQVRHAVFCKKCNQTIESTYSYDFQLCSCGSVGIDGGVLDGNPADMESRSMYKAIVNNKNIWLPLEVIMKL